MAQAFHGHFGVRSARNFDSGLGISVIASIKPSRVINRRGPRLSLTKLYFPRLAMAAATSSVPFIRTLKSGLE
jgi:hypothetical protein